MKKLHTVIMCATLVFGMTTAHAADSMSKDSMAKDGMSKK